MSVRMHHRVRRCLGAFSITGFIVLAALTWTGGCTRGDEAVGSGLLGDLARPKTGRAMRATSTMRVGDIRRGPNGERGIGERHYDARAEPRGDESVQSNWDNYNVEPGATHVLFDEQGPGIITHIWVTFLGPDPHNWAPDGSANHQEMMLRMYWDGEERPAVEAPFGDFFANCFGKRSEVVSFPVVVEDGDSYNSYWHMPFRKSARIEIENQSDKPISLLYFTIDWVKLDRLPKDTPYFHAQYRQEYPVENGKDYVLLETSGKGHYVGTVMGVRMRSPAWFGEGDEKIYIDGEEKPSIWGTGTEDYFLSAWGLKSTITPTFGVPYFDQRGIGGYTSAYRWHVTDPIIFNTGIKVTIEHMGWMSPDENRDFKSTSWNEREDDYASVAFWYQTGKPTFAARAPSAAERRLPSLDRIVTYGRDVAETARHGVGSVRTQPDGRGELLSYQPVRESGAWLEIPIEVKTKEPLHLVAVANRSPKAGRYQVLVNGVKVGGPIDLYAADTSRWEFHLLDFWPDPGKYTVRLESAGKNPLSGGFECQLESIRLRERRPRVAAYGHDKDKDWRQNPTLYR